MNPRYGALWLNRVLRMPAPVYKPWRGAKFDRDYRDTNEG